MRLPQIIKKLKFCKKVKDQIKVYYLAIGPASNEFRNAIIVQIKTVNGYCLVFRLEMKKREKLNLILTQ